jgi:hypothetical protein
MLAREGSPAPGFENFPNYQSAVFGNATTGAANMQPGSIVVNNRGQVTWTNVTVTVTDTGAVQTVLGSCAYSWDPVVGLRLLYGRGEDFTTTTGLLDTFTTSGPLQFPSGEASPLGLTSDGDLAAQVFGDFGAAIVRTKLGSLDGVPSALSSNLGGQQTLRIDAGIQNAGGIYAIAATASGTRPGFFFGGQQIPLNFDALTQLSIDNLALGPGAPWGTTFGLLDGNGKGAATFTIPSLPQFAGLDIDHAMVLVDLGLNVLHASAPTGVLLY